MPNSPDNILTIDLAAIAHNYRAMAALLPAGVSAAGVVKSDAYGHGAPRVAATLKSAGAPLLAVAVLAEAAQLRANGVEGPILILTGLRPGQAEQALLLRATSFIFSMDSARELSQAAQTAGKTAKAHLKVDTGMSRLGVAPSEVLEFLSAAAALPGLSISGLASHLATAGDPDTAFAKKQTAIFGDLLAQARAKGFELAESSLPPTGAVMRQLAGGPAPPLLARMGIGLYGGLADPTLDGVADLKGAMRYASLVVAVKTLAAGASVSYGCTHRLERESTLAVIPVGYADGYLRSLSNRARVLIKGQSCPVLGRVCMNMIMADVSHVSPLPAPGEEAVLLGRQGGAEITLGQVAEWAGTIPYEVACALGAANRRQYRSA